MDGTGSGSCPTAGCDTSGVEPWNSATQQVGWIGLVLIWCVRLYEGHLKRSWTGGSAPLLCRGRR
jgi:hypothetical protein